MRSLLPCCLVLTLLSGCSSAPETDEGFGFRSFERAEVADTDGDGLPDTRLPDTRSAQEFVDADGDGLPDARAKPARRDTTPTEKR